MEQKRYICCKTRKRFFGFYVELSTSVGYQPNVETIENLEADLRVEGSFPLPVLGCVINLCIRIIIFFSSLKDDIVLEAHSSRRPFLYEL